MYRAGMQPQLSQAFTILSDNILTTLYKVSHESSEKKV